MQGVIAVTEYSKFSFFNISFCPTKENAKINNEYNRSLGTLRPGGFVGHKEMLKNENFEYSVTAITPCKYYIMNDLAINNLVKDHPEIALEFQTALCRIIFDENQSTVQN